MFRTKRQRDEAACAFIAAVPILLVVTICTVIFVRRADPNNPASPDYVSPEYRSFRLASLCEISRRSYFEALPTSNIFLELLPSAVQITALGFGGQKNETTTWEVATHGPCTGNISSLPQPYMTYTIGPTTVMYNYITTRLFSGCYNYPCTTNYNTILRTTVDVKCHRTIRSANTYTFSNKNREVSLITSGEYTESRMTCTSSWEGNEIVGAPSKRSTTVTIIDGTCPWYDCSLGQVNVTIAGDLAGLTLSTTTIDPSSTRPPTSSMVTKTMSHARDTFNGTIPITAAPRASSSATDGR